MNELDTALIKFHKEKSDNLGDKDVLEVRPDLRMTKVAFDMYKVYGDHYGCLWKMENVNGKDFLVRASNPEYNYSNHGEWNISSDYEGQNITLSYRDTPIERFSSEEFGFNLDSALTFKTALKEKLDDGQFVRDVLSAQPKDKFNAISASYPELLKYFK